MVLNNATEKNVLHYLVRQPKIEISNPPLLILMHGVGSNEEDLFQLADLLPDKFLIVSARGPFSLGGTRFAWYQVDFSAGRPVIQAEQEKVSRKLILDFITRLKQEQAFDEKQIYLGGFSQGAIMSYSVGLTHPEKVKGIIALSGRLLEEVKPEIASEEKLHHLRVFIGHGLYDNVLGIHYARETATYLKRSGVTPALHEYDMAHGIQHGLLQDLSAWLETDK